MARMDVSYILSGGFACYFGERLSPLARTHNSWGGWMSFPSRDWEEARKASAMSRRFACEVIFRSDSKSGYDAGHRSTPDTSRPQIHPPMRRLFLLGSNAMPLTRADYSTVVFVQRIGSYSCGSTPAKKFLTEKRALVRLTR